MECPHLDPRLKACSHGNNVLRKIVHCYGPEAAELGVKAQHLLITLPHFTEDSFRTAALDGGQQLANHALGWRVSDPRQHLRGDEGGEVLQHRIVYRPLNIGGGLFGIREGQSVSAYTRLILQDEGAVGGGEDFTFQQAVTEKWRLRSQGDFRTFHLSENPLHLQLVIRTERPDAVDVCDGRGSEQVPVPVARQHPLELS